MECSVEIPGWRIHLAHLIERQDREMGSVMELAAKGALAKIKKKFPTEDFTNHETCRSVRSLFAKTGLNPATTPPVSELMMKKILKEDRIALCCRPWDFYLLLMAHSLAPWSVINSAVITSPLVFRMGRKGETLDEQDCRDLPILADTNGPRAAPWHMDDPEPLKDCKEPLYVCYMPEEAARRIDPKSHLGRINWMTWAYHFVVEKTFKSAG